MDLLNELEEKTKMNKKEYFENLSSEELGRRAKLGLDTLTLLSQSGNLVKKVEKILIGEVSADSYFTQAGIADNLGDILETIAIIANEYGYPLERVVKMHLDKLKFKEDQDDNESSEEMGGENAG